MAELSGGSLHIPPSRYVWPIQHGYEICLRYKLETRLRMVWVYVENILKNHTFD